MPESPASEFASGKPLFGKYSRVGNGPDNGKDDDWDENGVDDAAPATNGIRSPNFTLTTQVLRRPQAKQARTAVGTMAQRDGRPMPTPI